MTLVPLVASGRQLHTMRALAVVAAVIPSAACRIDFDELRSADERADANGADTATNRTVGFGEYPGADVSNVTQDAEIQEGMPMVNLGGEEFCSLVGTLGGRARAVVRFDLASVPQGTTVTSASLTLSIVDFGDQVSGAVEVAPLLESWTELDVSWNQRDSSRGWMGPGGTLGPAAGSVVVGSTTLAVTLPVPWIQGWIDDPTSNFGLVVRAVDNTDTHYHFGASEALSPDARPKLVLQLRD